MEEIDYSEEAVLSQARDALAANPPMIMDILTPYYDMLGLTSFQGNFYLFLLLVLYPLVRIVQRSGLSLKWLGLIAIPVIVPIISPLFAIFPVLIILAHKRWPNKTYPEKAQPRKTVSQDYGAPKGEAE